MSTENLDTRIRNTGHAFFESIQGEAPSIFNKSWWTGKIMDWSMRNEDFKVKMFRFVDVVPYLSTTESLTRHIEEYFAAEDGNLPPVMQLGLKTAGLAGKLGGAIMGKSIRSNIEGMGRQFIVGQTAEEAIKSIGKLRGDGFSFVIDMLGEATVAEGEADKHRDEHLELIDALDKAQKQWPALGKDKSLDWGHAPKINLALKLTAFYSQTKAADMEGSVEGILKRIAPIYRRIRQAGGFLCIDMEQVEFKEITLEVFRRLRSMPEFRDYPHLGIVLQTYLRDAESDAGALVAWARKENLPISIRLVKGAYWDYETVKAKQNGWPVPVWTIKAQSDACYERVATLILKNADLCHLACASHNIRTISAILETAKSLGVNESRYEFQVLYGMAEPVRKGLLGVAGRVRLYCPYGNLIPGMAYLVRRLLENTANESFLRQSFEGQASIDKLLEDPEVTAAREVAQKAATPAPAATGLAPFANEASIDYTLPKTRESFLKAIQEVRSNAGKIYPLVIGGKEKLTEDKIVSRNPANQEQVIGQICQAGRPEIDEAIAAAKKALPAWRNTPAVKRAEYLFKAADLARQRIHLLSAQQVLEVGKQWDQAYADVGEAIDFLEYYGREIIRLGASKRMGRLPGEVNLYGYRPKGIAAVIAPWNFPLAIGCGMAAAAIAAGNCVLFKPSSCSSVVGFGLLELFRDAGLPEGVFNFTPGRSSVMGDYLCSHRDIAMIAFTGSMEVGQHIMQLAATPAPNQSHCKKVIAELGGKNAIIVDDDAECDEAVLQVLNSAFAFQGQKCSACSRVIVVEAIYDKFVSRLVEAAGSLRIGPAENPANFMGPVVTPSAQTGIVKYIQLAMQEGKLLLSNETSHPDKNKGCYVPMTIVGGITPEHRLAQEEIFGPVLAVMKVRDFNQAIEWANSTRYALTGAVFSRSPRHLEQARREFEVGNLYLNRGSTGAMVGRQAFGGYKMSGIGSKAGGPDYLLQFMDPVSVTENTMRRGFTPISQDDDWV